jgi:hypothetical protein
MTKKELKKLIKEVINEAKFDDMQINSPNDLDYSDAKPGQVVTVQEMQSSVNMLKKFLKLGQYVLPKNMLSSFREYITDIETDLAEISQLQSATPFNKYKYLDAISRFEKTYGKIIKP